MHVATNEYGIPLKVLSWMITSNGWEYYITELPDENGIGFAYVQGSESEFGSFFMEDLKPYITMARTADQISTDPKSSNFLAPPRGGEWLPLEEGIEALETLTVRFP